MRMRRSISLFSLLISVVLFLACGGEDPSDANTKTEQPTEEVVAAEQQKTIAKLEDELYQKNLEFDRRAANQIFDVYLAYAAEHPLDTLTPEYLFRAGQVSTGLKKNELAIKIYDRIIKNYPDWNKIVETKFMKGFTYENHLDRLGAAKEIYQDIIYDHPDHPLAAQAKQLIDNMQYSDEELIKKWQEENASSN